jgi:hypothetical protein
MPPQWNPADDIPDAPPLPPLVAERGPLDDILAGVPRAPVQSARAPQAIPDDLVSMVPSLPPPPVVQGAKPQPVDDGIPTPPPRTVKPQPVESLYEIPAPPKVAPADIAPDFAGVNLDRALDVVEAPSSVDVTGAAQRAQTAERNLTTFTRALGDAQRETVEAAQRAQVLEQQAAGLDQQIAALKGAKKPTPEQKAELATLTKQRAAMASEIKAAGTAVQEALGRFTATREQQAIAGQDADQARLQAETDLATMEREAEIRGLAAQEAGAALFAAESKKIEADARGKEAKIEAEESAARARMDEDRKVYREALKTGPAKTSMVLTVASVIAEALAARHTGREPNFGSVIGQLEQATKGEFNDRVQRQLALIAESEDSLSKAAQQKRVIDAQKAERRAEILATIEMDIQSKMAGARGTAREAQLAMVAGDVRKAKEAAEHQALIEQQKAAQANEKARLDRELQEAQIRKAEAEAAEKEAEAARKAGLGGKKKPEALNVRSPTEVVIPGTDTKLADFAGQKNAEKRATEANSKVETSVGFLQQINAIEAKLEDYGRRGLTEKAGWLKSAEYIELEQDIKSAGVDLAKVIAGYGLATTANDTALAADMIRPPSGWWEREDGARVAAKALRQRSENRLRLALNAYLNTTAQETLIRETRKAGVSRTDLQRALVDRAPEVLTDATRPVDARLGALESLGENIRKGLNSEGEQAERDAILAEIQELKNATTQILEAEYDPDDPESGVTDDAYVVVEAMRKRQRELERRWREIGKSGTGVTERKQRDEKAGPGPKPSKIGGLL